MCDRIPDGSIPTSVQQLGIMREITGGKRVGNNLFCSFEEFSILTGTGASLKNAVDIENIFACITGGESSFIDGLLQTQGSANLFLVNPNGIVFGENAQLYIDGSFIATTADKIEFADGTELSTRDSNIKLTVNTPIGLGLYGDNGSITVNGAGNQITSDSGFSSIKFSERPSGIFVNNGQILALVGNRIDLNGGAITTEDGNIYLTSVESGFIEISQTDNKLTLNDENVTKYQDINLNQQSFIDASGEKVGSVFVSGQNINLSNASLILSQNQGNSSGNSINVKASEKIAFNGTSENGNISSNIRSETLNTGEGANINIFTTQLTLQDSARLRTNSFSNATAGSIKINSSEFIQLSDSSLSASAFAEGNAGSIEILTSELRLTNGSSLTSSTIGKGDGGEVSIQANSIEVIGATTNSRSNISASTFSSGNAGNIKISTERLQVKDGGSVSSSSFAYGNAGNININTTEFVEVSGRNESFLDDRSLESTVRTEVRASSINGQKNLGLPIIPTGNSGNLTINTPSLIVNNQAAITVANQGTGRAGKLIINADSLKLDIIGKITAAAESGQGGNIELNTKNLQIGEGSQITGEAGNDGNGGNITINTGNLITKKFV